jgi:hypothetical protein
MSNLKCPFCQQELQYDDLLCSCINEHCEESFDMVGTELLWEKVIDLKQEIDSTRKALDIAKDKLDTVRQYHRGTAVIRPDDIAAYCDRALEQITALEQKDEK